LRQTLLYIPTEIYGVKLFGFGALLAVWAVLTVVLLVWMIRKQGFNDDTRAYLLPLLLLGGVIGFLPAIVGEEQGLPIRGYGVALLTAIVSSVALFVWRGKRRGFDPELLFSMCVWMVLGGIGGARLFYIIEYFDQFRRDTIWETIGAMLNMTQGGLVVFGSLIGGAAAALTFVHRHRLPALVIGDLVAPSLALGIAIGRIGCFMNGCCYGGQCERPWALQFPWGSPPHLRHVEEGKLLLYGIEFDTDFEAPALVSRVVPGSLAEQAGVRAGQTVKAIYYADNAEAPSEFYKVKNVGDAKNALLKINQPGTVIWLAVDESSANDAQAPTWRVPDPLPRSLPIHPTQIYSAVNCFLILFLLLAYEPFQRRTGELLALLITLKAVSRFVIEVIRTDEHGMFGTPFSISQLISIAALVGVIILWAYVLRQPARPAAATR
jgi:phosphatidylglycerol:prolipoprotein diacylglycerol transferase